MKGKISQFLSRFSLYDTTGLAKETRKNLRLVILGVVIGNVSFTITGGTALTGYIKALGASDLSTPCCWRCPMWPSSCSWSPPTSWSGRASGAS